MSTVVRKCCVCGERVSKERHDARGPYCTAQECVLASLRARQEADPIVLINQHKAGYEPAFLSTVKNGAYTHPKKG